MTERERVAEKLESLVGRVVANPAAIVIIENAARLLREREPGERERLFCAHCGRAEVDHYGESLMCLNRATGTVTYWKPTSHATNPATAGEPSEEPESLMEAMAKIPRSEIEAHNRTVMGHGETARGPDRVDLMDFIAEGPKRLERHGGGEPSERELRDSDEMLIEAGIQSGLALAIQAIQRECFQRTEPDTTRTPAE